MRGDLRKLIASAVTGSDLTDNVLVETHLDRVMALGLSSLSGKNGLGPSLWRLKYAHDASEYKRAILLLERKASKSGRSSRTINRICQCVLDEWLDEACRKCEGRGYTVIEGTPHAKAACPTCAGSKVRIPSAQSRMTFMGMSAELYRKWEFRFDQAYRIIIEADDLTRREIATWLGRTMNRKAPERKMLAAVA